MSSKIFLDIVKNRRTIYQLQKSSTISDKQIKDIITQAVLHVPSPFNLQSARIILLLGKEHDKVWEITKEALKKILPAERYPATEQKLDGFKAAYGTVLFFDSRSSVSSMQEKFPRYATRFPTWAAQSNAMHQFAIWTALEAEGLGCNLQHYNPIIDERVAAEWNVPSDWELDAQLVFGAPVGQAGEKTFLDVDERFKVYGAQS
ncbi:Nitroreductase-like protein [Xylogone sp. PMI_703]|nr:Nitroreductase-like protein [Xylogone sp. PMI_703]